MRRLKTTDKLYKSLAYEVGLRFTGRKQHGIIARKWLAKHKTLRDEAIEQGLSNNWAKTDLLRVNQNGKTFYI